MVKVPLLVILFFIQFLVLSIIASIVLFKKVKTAQSNFADLKEETVELKQVLKEKTDNEVMSKELEEKVADLEEQYEKIKKFNDKLRQQLERLVPQAQRTEEYEKIIGEIEESYAELYVSMEKVRSSKNQIMEEDEVHKREIEKLNRELDQCVSRQEYDNLEAKKSEIELQNSNLKADLEEKEDMISELNKKYDWLEKEYNALYENINEGTA